MIGGSSGDQSLVHVIQFLHRYKRCESGKYSVHPLQAVLLKNPVVSGVGGSSARWKAGSTEALEVMWGCLPLRRFHWRTSEGPTKFLAVRAAQLAKSALAKKCGAKETTIAWSLRDASCTAETATSAETQGATAGPLRATSSQWSEEAAVKTRGPDATGCVM
mgnify:CR=1 FL=1